MPGIFVDFCTCTCKICRVRIIGLTTRESTATPMYLGVINFVIQIFRVMMDDLEAADGEPALLGLTV